MTRSNEDRFKAALAVTKAKKVGGTHMARCVCHEDRNPSMALDRGDKQPYVATCFSGCRQSDVFAEIERRVDEHLGTSRRRLNGNGRHPPRGKFIPVTEYGYTDALGEIVGVSVRGERDGEKAFQQKRPKPGGGYEWKGMLKKDRVPFNLPAVIEAIGNGQTILLPEGEKDVITLAKQSIPATCNIGGAGKWGKEESEYLADADVVLLTDHDDAGRKHEAKCAKHLHGKARRIRIVRLPRLECEQDASGADIHGEDVTDWFEKRNGTVEELNALIEKAPNYQPGKKQQPSGIADTPIVQEAMRRRDPHGHWQNEPWPDPIETVAILDEIKACIEKYVILPKHASTFLALWGLHTWVYDAANISPFALIVSPTKQCGKTTLLIVLKWITSRSSTCSNISASCLFRYVEMHAPTMIIDEADSFVKGDEAMRNILNSGHTRETAFAWRNVEVKGEHIPTPFSTWAPKAIASIGGLADTLMDRGIRISLRRKKRGEKTARSPMRDRKEFQVMRSKLQRWADDHFKRLDNYTPTIPDELHNRIGDNWEALLAIAELAGQTWWDATIAAAKAAEEAADHGDIKEELLADIHGIMGRYEPEDFISSSLLAEKLGAMDERPWSSWGRFEKAITTQAVARMLGHFEIKSLHTMHGNGYKRRQFVEVWECHLGLK